jgi:hypothetical protein
LSMPWPELMRQRAPTTDGLRQVADGVEKLAQVHCRKTTALGGGRMGLIRSRSASVGSVG